MAPQRIAAPGTEYGPCSSPHCGHTDCAQTRVMAESICHYCNQPIGYDKGFFLEEAKSLVHAVCLEDHIEQLR